MRSWVGEVIEQKKKKREKKLMDTDNTVVIAGDGGWRMVWGNKW